MTMPLQEDEFAKMTERIGKQGKRRKRKIRGILGLMAVAALVVFMFSNSRKFQYEDHGNYIEITKYQHEDSVVTIPSKIKGKPVKKIGGKAFLDCKSLRGVKIPDSVAEIGNSAFSGCSNLTSIEIPDGVKKIEWSTFYCCEDLTEAKIPEGTEIVENAFDGCDSLVITRY